MSEVENKSESIGGEERVKKEEFHVEVKTKDTKPNDVVEEKMELELKTKVYQGHLLAKVLKDLFENFGTLIIVINNVICI